LQSLVTSSAAVQEEVSLRARLVLLSVAGGIAQRWTGPDLPELQPYAERVERVLDLRSLAVLSPSGEVLRSVGGAPSTRHIEQVSHLRLRATPSSLWALTSHPLEMVARAPIVRNDHIVGYVFCTFTSAEPGHRLAALVRHALYSALFWMALGGSLTLWVSRRITGPLVALARDLSTSPSARYVLPPEGPAHGELGIVQRRLADYTTRLRDEQERVETLNAALRHQVEVVSTNLARIADERQAILDAVEDAILVCDAEGTVLAANRAAREWLAGPTSEPGDLDDRLAAAIQRVARSGRAERFPVEIERDGSPLHLRVRVAPAALRGPQERSVIVVVEDLSTWRELEAKVLRSERLASLGTLSAGLAHQIGNHLNAIGGYTALVERALLKSVQVDEQTAATLARVRKEIRLASDLLDRVLQLARTRPMASVPVEIPLLIREAISLTDPHARHAQVRIETRLAEPGCVVRGDPQLLIQVLLNLLLNAAQAMPEGGTLHVRTTCRGDGLCRVEIEDEGPGVDPALAEQIFEPFFTTKPMGEGTGLGLPIARRIVELHGGTLVLGDARGDGACFVLTLPVACAERRPPLTKQEGVSSGLLDGLFSSGQLHRGCCARSRKQTS
jgi:signal transduction histidine kinase